MFDISLIIPTYGRYTEVEKLLQSIAIQTYPLEKIEVIVIDQNDSIDLSPVISKYSSTLNVIHEKTLIKGIANAKNTGIYLSKAPLITFPDDDCIYYEDTVASAISFFDQNAAADVVYARIYDRQTQSNIMRNWPAKNIELNLYNFHLRYSAVTCFSKRKDFLFDTRFGVGSQYSSGEELDYVISVIEKKNKVIYTHTIDMWHPKLDLSVMPLNKIYNYAKGYAAICKKHLSFPIGYLFFKSVINQVFRTIIYMLLLNKEKMQKHYTALKGRMHGFMEFKN